ncbi:cytochrome P450 89A2-like [Hordeum vulgare subsp. vulgare]|uniref:cytochrome P450 89A2-like n=1 Tax=Hordeum vulgare subsp. vulgare TaxID=112509 RepID=UPI001D1A4965|nr:cytochrome P450 89A2-like [Hordeum vulgare subsp. vulgare]
MEDWVYYSLSITLSLVVFSSLCKAKCKAPSTTSLPPGPTSLTAFGPLLLLAWTSVNIESVVRVARSWYGPVFTLYLLPSFPVVFVADRAVAHRVLVQRGSAFADRPPANLATRIFSSNQHNITTAAYGPLWRALRQNLTGRALHPSSIPRYAAARRRAASGLVDGIARQMRSEAGVVVIEPLLHEAVFHVLACMCFGQGLDAAAIAAVTSLQRELLKEAVGFQVFGSSPKVTKLLFWRRYRRMLCIRRRQEEVFIPLIRACHARCNTTSGDKSFEMDCYVDSLIGLLIPEQDGSSSSRYLTDGEIVALCTEFLSGPIDSTVNVLQWAMANLVARPEIQAKLRTEIHNITDGQVQEEERLPRMPYLRAVVLESLRRHPPARFIMPHAAVGEDGAALDGFTVPKEVSVNFTVGDMAMDRTVWPDPTRFRPERFLPGGEGEDLDLTGSKEIKMMPFGAGRRMCPGIDVSLLHVNLLLATMVTAFQWSEVPGEPVDFTDKLELTMVMKRPLHAKVVPCHATS